MKFNRLQKLLTCLLMSVLALQASYFFLAGPAKATNTQTWSEITPRQSGDPSYSGWFGTLPPLNDLRYADHPSYYTPQWTSVTDLVETKPNGSKVFHFFVGIPYSDQYYWNGYRSGRIYHYSSADPTKTWNLINPTDWGTYGGSSYITLKAVKTPWVDSSGSIWNKKLFLFCNSSTFLDTNYPSWGAYYTVMKASFYRYDGNGSAANWTSMANVADSTWRYFYGNYISSAQAKGHYNSKMYFDYIDCSNNGIDDGTIYLVAPYATSTIFMWSQVRARLRLVRYTGTYNDLINNPTPPRTWAYTEIARDYVMYYYTLQYLFDVEKVVSGSNQYLFISTVSLTGNPTQEPYNGNGLLYRYDACTHAILYPTVTLAPTGRAISGVSLVYVSGIQYYRFTMITAGSLTKTAYMRRANYANATMIYMNFWGNESDYTWAFYWSYSFYWQWYINPGFFAPSPRGYFDYAVESETASEIYLSAAAFMPQYAYGYYSTILDGSPSPISLEFYKGDLYAGGRNGILRRTNNFNTLDFNTWTNVGPITATNSLGQVRNMTYHVTALGKNTKINALGQEEDVTMFIGGFQQSSPYSTGEGILYATNGGATTPLSYFIVEDEWRYTKSDVSATRMYKNTIWMIYDIYSSSLGLIVSFSSSRRRASISDGGGFGDRYFHLYNALPTCDIVVNPDPVINERGSDSEVCFTFTGIGGFGSGNVQIYLQGFPINVYLPKKDVDGNLVNTQVSDSPTIIKSVSMNGNILTVCALIRSTRSAQVGTYTMTVTIVDLVLGIPVSKDFKFIIIYPKPGFSERVSPSMFSLYQGLCDTTTRADIITNQYCQLEEETHCQMVNVDIESRNDFEDNVLIGIYWVTEPDSKDITFEWQQSPFIYDNITDTTVEVITRKNISTRYQFLVKVTPDTTVGVWKAKLFFLSGSIKHFKTLTITVLRAKPRLEITSIPRIIRVVPGATAEYRIEVKSIDYLGKAKLSLANVPPDVEVVEFYAENPPPGYTDDYVDLVSGGVAYARLVLRTYAITIDPYPPNNVMVTNFTATKNVISWDGSKPGTNPLAGYEIWRGLSQYTDKALKLGSVPATTTQFDDDNFDRTKTYYYFVRAFDDQIPPNYSEFTQSDPFKMASTPNEIATIQSTVIPHDGSAPGRYEIYVIAEGAGFNDVNHQQTSVCCVGVALLQIYEQMEDMATPFFSTWGWILILIAMVSAFYVVSKRIEIKRQ